MSEDCCPFGGLYGEMYGTKVISSLRQNNIVAASLLGSFGLCIYGPEY